MAITERGAPRRTIGSGLDVFSDTPLPPWARIRQELDSTDVGSIPDAVAREFAKPGIGDQITKGKVVVLTAGSRGIDRIAEVLKACVIEIRNRGGEPFIIPAMGSHGGATAEGQMELIAHYGVTEAAMGAPIRASMETVHLGTLDGGVPVWFDRIAHETADLVIPVGRVKPHTDFRGPVESGLMKMIAIGLGKQHGASWFHSQGIHTFGDLIPKVAEFTLQQEPIPFGIALVENGHCKLAMIEAVLAARILEREIELLEIANGTLATLPPVERLDVLIIDEIGRLMSDAV
ncbi:MAG TPA: lactate racemase domain-containing protein, partial [Thermomicrobiales bacterium]|nr:lactate racemase domain-containing protein [Thermomicrobiales bacterium]